MEPTDRFDGVWAHRTAIDASRDDGLVRGGKPLASGYPLEERPPFVEAGRMPTGSPRDFRLPHATDAPRTGTGFDTVSSRSGASGAMDGEKSDAAGPAAVSIQVHSHVRAARPRVEQLACDFAGIPASDRRGPCPESGQRAR